MLLLFVTTLAAYFSASLGFQMRTPADQAMPGQTLDSTVLIGLVLPLAVLAGTLGNPGGWLERTSPRSGAGLRLTWILILNVLTVILATLLAISMNEAQLPATVFMATLCLYSLSILSSVILGFSLCWVVPAAVAIASSTPGLLPLDLNWLVLANRSLELGVFNVIMMVAATVLYTVLDASGFPRQRNWLEAQSGLVVE